MLDIVSVIREKIFRRPKLSQKIAGEELSEKQTTKLGYFLLFLMLFAIIVSGQWTLGIIKNLVDRPNNIPYCVEDMISVFEKYNYTSYNYNYNYKCKLVSINPKFNLQKDFDILSIPYNQIILYSKKVRNLESNISKNNYNNRNKQNDYNTSLTEIIANRNSGLYNTKDIQNSIKNNNYIKSNLNISINNYKKEIDNIRSNYKKEFNSFKEKVKKAKTDYRISYLFYKFYVAILSFIFIIITFVVLYKIYVKQKLKNSPHTIIFSIATFAYGLVFLEIAFSFIWDIIPNRLLEFIVNLFSIFTPLIYIVQFLWPIIIITIFGFLVYRIQKRLYSTNNVLKRFIADKKCPNCGNRVDFTKPFCSLCSHEIHIHCNYCHELTLKGMPYCSNCGGKLPKKNIIINENNNLFDNTFNKILKEIKVEDYKGVKFIPNEGKVFTSSRENIIKIAIFMTNKLERTEFNSNDFSPYLNEIIKHIKQDNIRESELNRILGRIKSWVELGGKVILLKK